MNEEATKAQPGSDEIDEAPAIRPRPMLELLSKLRSGRVMDLMAIETNRVVKAVADCQSNKDGEIVLKLKISKVKRAHRGVFIQAIITGKAPEDPPDVDLLFYDDDGNLHRENPDQRDMFEGGPRSL